MRLGQAAVIPQGTEHHGKDRCGCYRQVAWAQSLGQPRRSFTTRVWPSEVESPRSIATVGDSGLRSGIPCHDGILQCCRPMIGKTTNIEKKLTVPLIVLLAIVKGPKVLDPTWAGARVRAPLTGGSSH